MRTLSARLIVTLCLASLVACTTVHPLAERGAAPLSSQQVQASIKLGDKVTVTRVDGSMVQMYVHTVLPESLEGPLVGSSEVTRVPIDQIRKIERRDVDGAKTALLGAGVLGIFGLAINSLIHSMF